MPSYRPSQAAELLGVSVDTVRRWADEGRLQTTKSESGHRQIDGKDLARFLTEQASTPVADGPVQSARNRFVGIVTKVQSDPVMSQVELQCGPFRVVSLMSTEAVHELALEPGSVAVAVVKATTVIVEAPRPAGAAR